MEFGVFIFPVKKTAGMQGSINQSIFQAHTKLPQTLQTQLNLSYFVSTEMETTWSLDISCFSCLHRHLRPKCK